MKAAYLLPCLSVHGRKSTPATASGSCDGRLEVAAKAHSTVSVASFLDSDVAIGSSNGTYGHSRRTSGPFSLWNCFKPVFDSLFAIAQIRFRAANVG
jgi:hypothetical protein